MNKLAVKKLREIAQRHKLKRAALPEWIEPQLATLSDALPDDLPPGDDWLHEVKFDGYRILLKIRGGKPRFFSRNHLDWTEKLESLAGPIAELGIGSAFLDGEIGVLDKAGATRFQLLQNSLKFKRDNIVFFLFDCMYLDGVDLRKAPLADRKELLRLLFTGTAQDRVRFSDDIRGSPKKLLDLAAKLGLEGILSKQVAGNYISGRTRSWLKVKCISREEFVIGGFTPHSKQKKMIGALLLGSATRNSKTLLYSGKVGTGFGDEERRELFAKLSKLESKSPPFAPSPLVPRSGQIWIKPHFLAEISFTEKTNDGLLRHPSFQGLRLDKTLADLQKSDDRQLRTARESKKTRRRNP